MSDRNVSRRRFIGITGAAAGLTVLPPSGRAVAPVHHWNGVALGARASIQLVHPHRPEARRIIDLAVREIERLEAIFSLYRVDSAVSRLNRDGRLTAPPLELVDLLHRAALVSEASGGLFDVTVQPLYRRLHQHYAYSPQAKTPPPMDDLLHLVDWRRVELDSEAIAFGRRGMEVTLNGIAQGYITDRVADLLVRNGIGQVLLDLGETRALGERADGQAWRVGIADPGARTRIAGYVSCVDRAVATSGGYGTILDRAGRVNHLIDPRDGTTAALDRSVTVVAGEACHADAWSTACALMNEIEICTTASRMGRVAVYTSKGEAGLIRLV